MRVVIAEDLTLLRDGLARLLRAHDFDVVAEVGDAEAVARALDEQAPVGGTVLDPKVVEALLSRHQRSAPLARLSPREREVMGLIAEGRSNAAIATTMFITGKAVDKHINSIFTKLDLPLDSDDNRRVLAVLRYMQDSMNTGHPN